GDHRVRPGQALAAGDRLLEQVDRVLQAALVDALLRAGEQFARRHRLDVPRVEQDGERLVDVEPGQAGDLDQPGDVALAVDQLQHRNDVVVQLQPDRAGRTEHFERAGDAFADVAPLVDPPRRLH